mmetsp:Transcript_8648/g.27560  ORF Transcript_8648/g.27560 Transcript_8648/m.27560 type:complete len:227 (+) Transcript_8648:1500-2180(+)
MLRVHLLLLALAELRPELIPKPLEELHNAAGLELVGVGLGRLVGHPVWLCLAAGPAHHADEGRDQGPGLRGQPLPLGHLDERLLRAGAVVVLLLEHHDGTIDGVDALRVVLRLGEEVLVVRDAAGCRGLLVRLVLGKLVVESRQGLAKTGDVALQLPDVRSQQVDLLAVLGNVALQACRLIFAPLAERCEGHLLALLVLLGLDFHVRQQLNDLLDTRHRSALLGAA